MVLAVWNAVVVDDRESIATTNVASIIPLGSGELLMLRLLVRLGLSCFMFFLLLSRYYIMTCLQLNLDLCTDCEPCFVPTCQSAGLD